MAVRAAEVDVILRAKDQMGPAITKAKSQVKGLADTTVGASKSMASAFKTMASAGALMAVATGTIAFGKASVEESGALIDGGGQGTAGPAAAARGLCLVKVSYESPLAFAA